jgi:hypothetical protein
MIEQVIHKGAIIAIVIRGEYKREGVEFFTPHDFSQQLGYMNRPKGYFIEPHSHRIVERKVSHTQEVLHLKSGKIKIGLFDNDQAFIKELVCSKGDTVLLATGGHSVEMLEDSEIIEIKQGPYLSDDDKIKFSQAMISNEERNRY